MNPITWQLVKKDWHFNKLPMLGYAVLSVVALVCISLATGVSFYVGSTLLITLVVVIGIHMIFVTTIHERSKQNLPFIMSLPITYMQYTRAKLIANIGVFGLAWLAITVGVIAIVSTSADLPNGFIPFASIILGELLAANILILGVAMVTESEAWTIVVMATCNLCISLFIYFASSLEAIRVHMEGPVAVWNGTALTMISLEALAILIIIALTFFAQARKNDYL